MKREARLLLEKACDSLLLSIELFNRPHDRGRVSSALILLDHAFEMQPSSGDLQKIGKDLLSGTGWPDIFKGVAAVQITTDGTGPSMSLRLTKKEGIPIQLVPEGTPGAAVVGVKRVNELDF